jgi:carbonic anhydrase/acetyltransferase-like protein (isoleucine patch superfamily)
MNAVVMDDVVIEDESIVGALSFVKAGKKFPPRSIIAGNPAKVVKEVSGEMIAWKTKGTQLYQSLPRELYNSLKEVEPLREIPANRPAQEKLYETWNTIRKD